MQSGRTRVPEIRKGDTVLVLTGKDAGKQGQVERVITNPAALHHVTPLSGGKRQRSRRGFWKPASSRPVSVVVEGINIAKKHQRKHRQQMQAGIIEKAMPLEVSNVMLLSPSDGKPTRVGYRFTPDGEKVRVCKRTGADIDG